MLENNNNYSYYKIPLKAVLDAYKVGLFPMAETADSKEIYWVEPKKRGVFFFDKIKVPKKLKKIAKSTPFEISVDLQFEKVIENCSKLTSSRKDTWINQTIKFIYLDLFYKGYAHSIECYLDKKLVGGLYGVIIGGVFFGESMFSFVTNSSKFALFHLMERLKVANFDFIDTQFINEHLAQFGAIEVPNNNFKRMLKEGVSKNRNFFKMHSGGFLPKELFPLNNGII
ncbi:MAG: leucyl/phenylalanyl-tRNA--protein transferase [Alphaproteobacteria bacterium TMED93]|nr:MAG: leucyl/phenylalanyl-tRNA--protein transferase [Alphaproteobacteria bacterium TMED93]